MSPETTEVEAPKSPKSKYPKPDVKDLSLFEPQTGYVVLQQWTVEEVTAGGIVIPNASDKKLSLGWVVKVGPVDPAQAAFQTPSEGDTVLFCPYAPTSLEGIGDNLLAVKTQDLLGIYPCARNKERSNEAQTQD